MKYLLDSDVIIDFLQNKGKGSVIIPKLIGESLFISVISWIEILYGVEKSHNPSVRRNQFEQFLTQWRIGVLSLDTQTAKEYVKWKISLEKKQSSLADFDLLIASSAFSNKLTLVTNNTQHFKRIKRLNLFV